MSVHASDVKLSPEAVTALGGLERSTDPAARSILRGIHALHDVLLANCVHGEVVRKKRIPRTLALRYGVENLYIEDLPSFWRLLYTVVQDDDRRYVVVLAIVDHNTYSKWFATGRR